MENNPLDALTCAVTSFKRTFHLDRAIASAKAAGIRRMVIASAEPTPEVMEVIERHRGDGWLSYDVATTPVDIGCNALWMLAAYYAKTDQVLLLHDDDFVCPEFGEAYRTKLGLMLASNCGFVCWRANHILDDGSLHVTEWMNGPTRVMQSEEIKRLVGRLGTLSLSPIVSILNRTVIIRACKEAEETLTHNDCLERPGMLLGTEILVYLRAVKASGSCFFLDQLLTHYGYHEGSGTVKHETGRTANHIIKGYDRARTQGLMRSPPPAKPKVILVHATPADSMLLSDDRSLRMAVSQASWQYQFGTFDMIERSVSEAELPRTGQSIGDAHAVPFVRDLLDIGCQMALPEDIVVFANSDVGLTVDAAAKLIAGVERGKGITICPRRSLTNPTLGRLYRTVKNCRTDGGMDVIAVSANWWETVGRAAMPDMLIGREAWDLCLRTIAEEWADGPAMKSTLTVSPDQWWSSRAYTDDVCWHEPHESFWKTARVANLGGAYNRKLAREFFGARKNLMGLACVAEPQVRAQLPEAPRPSIVPPLTASAFDMAWVAQWLQREPRVIFDIGAYDGDDSRRFKIAFPRTQVWAIEVDPINFERLRRVADGSGIHCVNVAMSDEGGEAEYTAISRGNSEQNWRGSGGILKPSAKWIPEAQAAQLTIHAPVTVSTTTLAQFCSDHHIAEIDVVHMDVQGAEGLVIQGMGQLRPRMIFLETQEVLNYEGAMPLNDLYELLYSRGYAKRWEGQQDALFVYDGVPS